MNNCEKEGCGEEAEDYVEFSKHVFVVHGTESCKAVRWYLCKKHMEEAKVLFLDYLKGKYSLESESDLIICR